MRPVSNKHAREAELLRWAVAVSKLLVCAKVESFELEMLVEEAKGFDSRLLTLVVKSRMLNIIWSKKVKTRHRIAKCVSEALSWLREQKFTREEIIKALELLAFLHRTYSKIERDVICSDVNEYLNYSFKRIVENLSVTNEILQLLDASRNM